MIKNLNIRQSINQGIIAGIITLSVSVIGMVELFGERFIVADSFTMGQALIVLAPFVLTYFAVGKEKGQRISNGILSALIISGINALMLVALILVESRFDIRSLMPNVSPSLIELITFGRETQSGIWVLIAIILISGLFAAALKFIPKKYSGPLIFASVTTLMVGLLSELLLERVRFFFGTDIVKQIFESRSLKLMPAILLFSTTALYRYLMDNRASKAVITKQASTETSKSNNIIRYIFLGALLLILPRLLGGYLTEITNNIGIFLLMGLGLNIVVGLAGLLDLGYVAFFAIGAYTMAVLTSQSDLGLFNLSFWAALPISVAVASFAGIILGMPVLKMRGDYLAIVTLGFGEIIRILALSDMLKPYIGGAQGILKIPKPEFAGTSLIQPEQLYFVILAAVLLAAFMSVRLRESRLGRQWMAMREDEDVAEAMSINLVKTKLLAFGIGAAFSGLAGAIFASKLTSIFPHSFSLLISINVLSLIIVGGLGSIPGTVVGAAILVGLPELLREFAEFRFLMYGLLLIAMMLYRPGGFIPSDVIKREMHSDEDETNSEATE
jgi:branched-chain amino acid transport system permease protein